MFKRSTEAAALAVAAILASAGCAPRSRPAGPDGPAPYPDWVRIVPAATEHVVFYVGGASIAIDPSDGVGRALADALSQAELDARQRFFDLFDRVAGSERARLSAAELERVRSEGASSYFARIEKALERRDLHQRACGRAGAPADEGAGGPVCETYILLELDGQRREALLAETLSDLRRSEREAGHPDTADLVERILRTLE